jgi:hypothetical protein
LIEGEGWWYSNAWTCEQRNVGHVKYVKDRRSRIVRDNFLRDGTDAGNLTDVSSY